MEYSSNLVPNISNEQNQKIIKLKSSTLSRNGRLVATKVLPVSRFGNLRFNSFPFAGARLFNALPKSLRNKTGCSKISFKTELDNYLKNILDIPLPVRINPCSQATLNSLVNQTQRRNQINLGARWQ